MEPNALSETRFTKSGRYNIAYQGIAVHIGARIAAAANPGQVWASNVVRDLAPGSGLVFEDQGTHQLKGVPDDWRLFSVAAG